ncbi:LysR family transcriptional regulator [Pseudomonas fluorescens]|uniref:LysR substrate-binding domain-containing protein n=1 Tax=Pseudomonas fluorescens TaxID=294 RepID=UPI001782E9C2|nr:LysR substrate-binding domain-containing protein [Pseudomonas fluorescens]MBD8150202.1 LysR family transcriptional regulator [Pseudomonas fluorescens]MBD8176011.1 LysR family transcriptional regulator [Pseudomonas fluorescens]MBD8744897.1 LysR family transcriptional regulator [Pseudomonas fluorescens]MBD8748683.1 LysR family transcriptional regulator [Pseudomonas fluorescens]MBD8762054.1 LysR family transcriptional regulator [Pseudomonas fluorescens]
MRLRHIEVIQAILQTGHLGTAAEWLQLPVGEVDATLRDAELQLGFMLFASVRGRLQATRETLQLQTHIAPLYEALEPIQRLASRLKHHHAPTLRVLCTPPLANQLLPHSIALLRRRFQDTPCNLSSQPTREIVRSLLLHETDVGLSLHDPEHPHIQSSVLAQGKLQLLAPHGWLKPRQKYIALQDLAGQSMIGLEGQDPLSRLLDAKLQALRPLPMVQTRVQTYQMMRSMVEAGEGLAVVDPFTACGAREAGLDVCPISPPISVSLYALTLQDGAPSPALSALLEIVTQQAETLLANDMKPM